MGWDGDERIASVRISAKADYAVRAAVTLAALDGDAPVKAERLASEQGIPLNFLERKNSLPR